MKLELIFLGYYSTFGKRRDNNSILNRKKIISDVKEYDIVEYQFKLLNSNNEEIAINFFGEEKIYKYFLDKRSESVKIKNEDEQNKFNVDLNEFISVIKSAVIYAKEKKNSFIGHIEPPFDDNGIWFITDDKAIDEAIDKKTEKTYDENLQNSIDK